MRHLSQKFIRLSCVRNGQEFVYGLSGEFLLRYRRLNSSRGFVRCIELDSCSLFSFEQDLLVRRVIETE